MVNKSSNLTQTILGRWVRVELRDTEDSAHTRETVSRLLPFDGGVLSLQANTFVQINPKSPEKAVTTSAPISHAQVAAAGSYLAFYQQKGTSLKLYRKETELCTIDTEFPILSATVNTDGNVTIVTENSGHKSAIAVYRKDGTLRYRWHSGAQLAVHASLSARQDELAVCTLSLERTKPEATLYLFDLKKTDPVLKQDLGNRVPAFTDFTEKDLIVVGFSDGISAFRRNGEAVYAIDCNGARLKNWSLDNPYAPRLLVTENGTDSVRFYDKDRLVGRYDSDRELRLLSAKGSLAAVSGMNRIALVDSHGRKLAETDVTQEVRALVLVDKKTVAVALGDEVRFLSIE